MTNFKNKETEITTANETGTGVVKLTYADLAVICMNAKEAQASFSIEEMGARLPIVKALKECKASGTVKLESMQVTKLKTQVEYMSTKWQFMHEDVLAFDTYVKSLK